MTLKELLALADQAGLSPTDTDLEALRQLLVTNSTVLPH